MVPPTSFFRETVVLIIFGIVLVPIAAKRAQDAPGYWQTFSKELQAFTYDDNARQLPIVTCSRSAHNNVINKTATHLPTLEFNNLCASRVSSQEQRQIDGNNRFSQQNESVTVYATSSANPPQVATRTPLTIRFHIDRPGVSSNSAETVAPAATPAPSLATTANSNAGAVEPTKDAESAGTGVEANRVRRTLIWMGTAITAVAAFMSSC